jgi:excinuclease UvrABC nuclease subunit
VTVPDKPGCYALATYSGDVLYVGLATNSIRARMGSHLDTEEKRKGTDLGIPFWFHYLVVDSQKVAAIERGWMNQAILADGETPALNKLYSPL